MSDDLFDLARDIARPRILDTRIHRRVTCDAPLRGGFIKRWNPGVITEPGPWAMGYWDVLGVSWSRS